MNKGLIHIYCGDGKGKTTASIGLTIRCVGRGGKVLFVQLTQFLKERKTGEIAVLTTLPSVTVRRGKGTGKFTFQMNSLELAAAKKIQEETFDYICRICRENPPDLLIMDEIIGACTTGLVSEDKLIHFLTSKPIQTEVVLTGRNPSQKLIALADYVSEIKKIKHPFDKGVEARVGIEE